MTFLEKMRGLMENGVEASRDFVSKAGAKAQDLSEKGVLKLEIMQLEGQASRLLTKLGAEFYAAALERREISVSVDQPVVKGLLAEIAAVKAAIEQREAALRDGTKS
jgi:hypothetical protein